MNGADIFTLTKQILGGGTGEYPLSETLFYSLLDIARVQIEGMRKWMVLRTIDTSKTVPAGNNWDTAIDLPTDFKRLTFDGTIWLYDSSSKARVKLYEVPLEKNVEYRDIFGHYAIDYSARKLYIFGNVPQPYTLKLPYIVKNTAITSNTSWPRFTGDYDAILAFRVASMHRTGIDYDDQNARNANRNMFDDQALLSALIAWDSSLQLSSVTNEDYSNEE